MRKLATLDDLVRLLQLRAAIEAGKWRAGYELADKLDGSLELLPPRPRVTTVDFKVPRACS
jgi:hypothetical protein